MTEASLPEIAVMLSAGHHPASARPRASMADRRSVGIALAANCSGPIGVHAGRFDSGVAYDFFAVGLRSIDMLECSAENDPLPFLVSWWRQRRPAVTLFGQRAEEGASTGTLPYFFAEKAGLPLVSGVVAVSRSGDGFEVTQTLSSSLRRQLIVRAPFVAVSSSRTPMPIRYSHAAARRYMVKSMALKAAEDVQTWAPEPVHFSVTRPMALRSDFGRSVEQRLGTLMGGDGVSRERHLDATPDDAARLILGTLESLELIETRRPTSR